jgi:hypothetical protein
MIAVAVTILVVAYVVVPFVADLVAGLGSYNPSGYEPRDFARMERQRAMPDAMLWTPEAVIKAALFVLLAVVWFVAATGGRPRGRPR